MCEPENDWPFSLKFSVYCECESSTLSLENTVSKNKLSLLKKKCRVIFVKENTVQFLWLFIYYLKTFRNFSGHFRHN